MIALLGLPLTLALVLALGGPLVRRLAPGLPRDLEVACGLGLGAGALGLWCFVLVLLRAQTPLAALLVLAAAPLLGRPRLPRRRDLLAPIAWFVVASLGLLLLQPVPRGAGWGNDWAWHFIADQHYADRKGFGTTMLPNGWPLLGRPPLFNLARLPAELLLGPTYASAEAATAALACVLPAGAWVLLRELAPFARARRALWFFCGSAWWVHFAAYPKPTGMATGLALATLGVVLRMRRREEPGLLPLAATLGALTVLTHPAAAFVLVPAALVAFASARRRPAVLALAGALVLAIALPWPLWANRVAGGLASQDPVRSFAGAAPFERGVQALAAWSWNFTASLIPSTFFGHLTALATGSARFEPFVVLDAVLDGACTALPWAIGCFALVAVWRRGAAPSLRHPRLVGAAIGVVALMVAVGSWRLLQPDTFRSPAHLFSGRMVDKRALLLATPLAAVTIAVLAVRIARITPTRGGADLVAWCVILGIFVGTSMMVRAEFHGIAGVALSSPCAILALWAWSEGLARERLLGWLAIGLGAASLLALGVAAALDRLPDEDQVALGAGLGFRGLHSEVGPLAWAGVALLGAAAVRAIVGTSAKSSSEGNVPSSSSQ